MAVGVGMLLMAIFHSLPTIWNYFVSICHFFVAGRDRDRVI